MSVKQDYLKAFERAKEIAENDEIGLAFYIMGICYEFGNGVEQDAQKAFQNYKSSANRGNISGTLNLAACYYNGIGVNKNYEKAFDLYSEVIDNDKSGLALRMMGFCFERGNGVERNHQKALPIMNYRQILRIPKE